MVDWFELGKFVNKKKAKKIIIKTKTNFAIQNGSQLKNKKIATSRKERLTKRKS